MIMRDELVDRADTICYDSTRLGLADIRELQDAHTVNLTGDDDSWLDQELPDNGLVSVISESEFFERYVF